MLGQARAGNSAVLVLGGESGIGKTALLGYAAGRAWLVLTTRSRMAAGRPEHRRARLRTLAGAGFKEIAQCGPSRLSGMLEGGG